MNKRMVRIVMLLSLLTACSVERGLSPIADIDYGLDQAVVVNDMMMAEESLSLDGKWILFTEDRRCIYPEVGDEVENIVWSLYLVELSSPGDASPLLNVRAKLCHQYLSPLPFGFVTIIPQAVSRSVGPIDFSGFLVGRAPTSSFVTEPATDMWGYDDSDPTTPLPTSEEDERIVDQDNDGLPGMTLPVQTPQGAEVCQVRVVQKTTLQLEGAVSNSRLIKGTLNVEPEQVVLSASTSLCAGGDVVPREEVNRFELVKLPSDIQTCEVVYERLAEVKALLDVPESTPDETNCTLSDD